MTKSVQFERPNIGLNLTAKDSIPFLFAQDKGNCICQRRVPYQLKYDLLQKPHCLDCIFHTLSLQGQVSDLECNSTAVEFYFL